ncbi:hypothetical protein P168DRAFT_268023 [Aspergillus campestris IBT 28561]|uniref:M protein repeat protein n=1 Tax=Aspergillus campestris (strain IBT 28561) TaxID=1392248 RepID=A0A2I1D5C2_ASPC2|nr:uncharacterized protein P168DRAFT_268023 [Aspergillus campestris IBT 28561]PKY05074.1 hypothetical protein P168DRAFT_268023 [Aspergillus campestris IBT 28561]
MADEEERVKAEKLAAAKKRVAQLQKKKKGGKKAGAASTSEAPKEAAESTDQTTPATEVSTPAEEDKDKADSKADEAAPSSDPAPQDDSQQSQPAPQAEESPVEPMPDAPTDVPTSPSPGADPQPASKLEAPSGGAHGRQPSLSIQSKMRSSSFRKNSVSQGSNNNNLAQSPSTTIKSPSLPPLSADGDSVHEVYKKQASRIEDLEKDNKRLEKELEEASGRWRKTEEQLEDLREASVDVAELKDKLAKAEQKAGDVEELKAEIASLQRQNSHLQTRTHRNNASVSSPAASESPPAELTQQLESKSATIEAMELEISNLRAQLSSSSAHESQIAALEEKLSASEAALERSQRELSDTKAALTRASEKAVKEGVDKTSTETLIKSLQREVEELKNDKTESEKKLDTLEKKQQAMTNLHKETEARHQARLRESEKTEKEAAMQRKRLASVENDNLRLKDELETLRKRHSGASGGGGADDDAIDELEDEERSRLHRRIRSLEGEVFDLRRGVWQEKREELAAAGGEYPAEGAPDYSASSSNANANAFDDVDLIGGSGAEHARRRSMAQQQRHSSFSTVLSSGLAAFTGSSGGPTNRTRTPSHPQQHHGHGHAPGSLELLSEENFDDEFDEDEFARAQAEEEGRKRVAWVREIKTKLRDWQGWRLDLVDSRAGAEGAGVGMGEMFEV